jgi:hypothetical protein
MILVSFGSNLIMNIHSVVSFSCQKVHLSLKFAKRFTLILSSILGTVQIRGTGGTAGTVLARTYLATVPNTHIHNFKALDENCNFFNDCNAIDNCSPAVTTVSITTTQESVIITPTIDFTTLTVTEFDTAAATTTAVIIIPELKSVKHWEQDGGYHKKDEDDEDLDEDDCEEDQ